MPQKENTEKIIVTGMYCSGCEAKIEKKLTPLQGVSKVEASYKKSSVTVTYNPKKITLADISQAILPLGYKVGEQSENNQNDKVKFSQLATIAIILLGVSLILERFGGFGIFSYFPQAKAGMSYLAIFVIGLLTSLHCVGMCGGICLSQCVGAKSSSSCKFKSLRPSFLYNLGRIISYTVIGAVVGALGSVVSFSGVMRGAVALLAGVFMIIMGLNMLNLFPWLRKLNLKLPKFLTKGMENQNRSPLYIGLLNGLMPCGPLQAMQLYALSTGSPIQGAISMFLFALGTSILMFGFGAVSALLTQKFTKKLMAFSAVLIIILGVGMFNTGLNMSGFLAIGTEIADNTGFTPTIVDGYQVVNIDVASRGYAPIIVKKGIPVKFNIQAQRQNLNGCNSVIIIPQYGIKQALQPGDNIINFTPTEEGVVPYSCWMNMIRSSITVVE